MYNTLNQIRKQYNDSINDIPEKEFRKIFNDLSYQGLHALFIEKDHEKGDKIGRTIKNISSERGPLKYDPSSTDQFIENLFKLLVEIAEEHNKKIEETRDFLLSLHALFILNILGDLKNNNIIISHIDNCRPGNEKGCLGSIRKELINVRDEEIPFLEKVVEGGELQETITYLENKKERVEHETEILKMFKGWEDVYYR